MKHYLQTAASKFFGWSWMVKDEICVKHVGQTYPLEEYGPHLVSDKPCYRLCNASHHFAWLVLRFLRFVTGNFIFNDFTSLLLNIRALGQHIGNSFQTKYFNCHIQIAFVVR